jgi:hypothetical protein
MNNAIHRFGTILNPALSARPLTTAVAALLLIVTAGTVMGQTASFAILGNTPGYGYWSTPGTCTTAIASFSPSPDGTHPYYTNSISGGAATAASAFTTVEKGGTASAAIGVDFDVNVPAGSPSYEITIIETMAAGVWVRANVNSTTGTVTSELVASNSTYPSTLGGTMPGAPAVTGSNPSGGSQTALNDPGPPAASGSDDIGEGRARVVDTSGNTISDTAVGMRYYVLDCDAGYNGFLLPPVSGMGGNSLTATASTTDGDASAAAVTGFTALID